MMCEGVSRGLGISDWPPFGLRRIIPPGVGLTQIPAAQDYLFEIVSTVWRAASNCVQSNIPRLYFSASHVIHSTHVADDTFHFHERQLTGHGGGIQAGRVNNLVNVSRFFTENVKDSSF